MSSLQQGVVSLQLEQHVVFSKAVAFDMVLALGIRWSAQLAQSQLC